MKPTIIIGERYTALLKNNLNRFGLEVLPLPDNPEIAPDLAGHTDLSVFYPGKKEIFLAGYLKNTEFTEELAGKGLHVQYIREKQTPEYPSDVPLNVRLLSGNRVLLNRKTVSKQILQYFEAKKTASESGEFGDKLDGNYTNLGIKDDSYIGGNSKNLRIKDENKIDDNLKNSRFTDDSICKSIEIIDVNQGYSACTTLDCRYGIISSDNGICEAARKHGLKVLQISQGFISLPGYSYGFIGGSAFLLENKMFFTGTLQNHPDRDRILSFLSAGGIEPIYLTNEEIFDIGGAVLISFPP